MSDNPFEPVRRKKNTGRNAAANGGRSTGSDEGSPRRSSKYNKKKKLKRRKRILFTCLMLLLFTLGFIFTYIYSQFSKLNVKDIAKDNESLGIKQEVVDDLKEKDLDDSITNIALFGIDSRDINNTQGARSDSIMIATIDYKHKKVKLSSIMRDSYVQIEGHGSDKINHAYAFGGAPLAIKTLNQNFDLNIRDYVTINFYGLEDIITSLGGITLEIKKNEVNEINKYIKELCDIDKKPYKPLKQSGVQKLDGRQAVSYARIRYVGNGDFERTERQRRVMDEVFKGVLSAGVTKYPDIVGTALPYVETSISQGEILSIGTKFLKSGIKSIDQSRFPVDGFWSDAKIKGVAYIKPKMPDTKNQMRAFIFDDIVPPAPIN